MLSLKIPAAVLLAGTAAVLACNVTSRPIEQVLAAHTDSLMATPGVVGVAIAACQGTPCIRVMIERRTPELLRRLPDRLEGYVVDIQETGPIRAR